MSVEITDQNPSYQTNRTLLADILKDRHEYPVVYFDDFSSGITIGGKDTNYKLKLIDDKLDIENVALIDLRICEWHWNWEDKSLSLIVRQSNFSVDIFF